MYRDTSSSYPAAELGREDMTEFFFFFLLSSSLFFFSLLLVRLITRLSQPAE